MTMFCAQCGNPIEDGHRFCESCGAPAPVDVAPSGTIPAAAQATPEQSSYAKAQPQAVPEQALYAVAQPQPAGGQYATGQTQPASGPAGSYPPPSTPIFNDAGKKKASGTAVAALVLGIIAVATSFFFIGIVFGIIAIVLFIVARKGGDKSGVGIAGLVTGIVGAVISLGMILLLCIGLAMADEVSMNFSDNAGISSSSYLPDAVTESQIVGDWRLDVAYVPEEEEGDYDSCSLTYSEAKKLEAAGDDAGIVLDSDGSYVLSFSGVEKKGTWAIDDYFIELHPEGFSDTVYAYYYDFDDEDEFMLVDGELVIDFVK